MLCCWLEATFNRYCSHRVQMSAVSQSAMVPVEQHRGCARQQGSKTTGTLEGQREKQKQESWPRFLLEGMMLFHPSPRLLRDLAKCISSKEPLAPLRKAKKHQNSITYWHSPSIDSKSAKGLTGICVWSKDMASFPCSRIFLPFCSTTVMQSLRPLLQHLHSNTDQTTACPMQSTSVMNTTPDFWQLKCQP